VVVEEVMVVVKMQPPGGTLRYLASGTDGRQDDVVVPVGRLHPGALQRGGAVRVGVVEEVMVLLVLLLLLLLGPGVPVRLLGRTNPAAPPETPSSTSAAAASRLQAVEQEPTGGGGAVVGRERRHGRRRRAGDARPPARGRGGGIVVGGGGLVGRPVDETVEAGLGAGARAPHHHVDFVGAVPVMGDERRVG